MKLGHKSDRLYNVLIDIGVIFLSGGPNVIVKVMAECIINNLVWITFIPKFSFKYLTLGVVVLFTHTVVLKPAELAFGDVFHPPWVVTAVKM